MMENSSRSKDTAQLSSSCRVFFIFLFAESFPAIRRVFQEWEEKIAQASSFDGTE